jgi:hypothetical protein
MTDLRKALDNLEKVCPYFPGDQELLDESIKALRQALEEPEQEFPVGYVTPNGTSAWIIKYVELDYDTPLYAAPPHYWGNVSNEELVKELRRRDMLMVPVKEQEPVAWMHNFIEGNVITHKPVDIGRYPERWTPLYTAPPQKEWVGLTDADIKEGADLSRLYRDQFEPVARWAESILKEKNT